MDEPLLLREVFEAVVLRLAEILGQTLSATNRIARRMVLQVECERSNPLRLEWVLPAPVSDISSACQMASVLLRQMEVNKPILSVRLALRDLETPTAFVTHDLFASDLQERSSTLAQMRALLCGRYGQNALFPLRELLKRVPTHERRIDAARTYWQERRRL